MSSDLGVFEQQAGAAVERQQPADLADVLERVLDTGIVVAGEIRIDLLDIELLTIRLRLVITSLDKAEEVGLDWWRGDPWFSASADDRDRRSLRRRGDDDPPEVGRAVPVVDVAADDRFDVVTDARDDVDHEETGR